MMKAPSPKTKHTVKLTCAKKSNIAHPQRGETIPQKNRNKSPIIVIPNCNLIVA